MRRITSKAFEQEVLKNPNHVVLLFTNDWNGSIVILKNMLEDLAFVYGNNFHFLEIDESGASNLCKRYGIKTIPTIMIIKNGEILHVIEGVPAKSRLEIIFKSLNSTNI